MKAPSLESLTRAPMGTPRPISWFISFRFYSDFDRLKTMLLNQWKSPNRERGGKAKSCSTALPAQAARRRRGSRDASAGGGPEHRLLGDKQRFCQKGDKRTRKRSLHAPHVFWGVWGVAVAVLHGALPVAESWAANGCPRGRRPAGAGAAAAAQLSRKKGKSDHQDYPP